MNSSRESDEDADTKQEIAIQHNDSPYLSEDTTNGNVLSHQLASQTSNTYTYLDSLVQHLNENNIKQAAVAKLVNYLKDHHFDTESMDIDLNDGESDGNISKLIINHQQCLDSIIYHLKETKGL